MTAVLGQIPDAEKIRLQRDRFMKEILANKRNIAIVSAHGEDLEEPPLWDKSFWTYADKNKMPKRVTDLLKILHEKHNLIVLSICNPRRILLPNFAFPTFYPLDSINTIRDNPDARLQYSGPE